MHSLAHPPEPAVAHRGGGCGGAVVRARDGFKARSGCFNCCVCGRKTRITSGHSHAGSEMCAECDEVSMCENSIDDCGDDDGSQQARIDELNQAAVDKGGVIEGYVRSAGAQP